jgi:hypothetical protein
MMASVSEDELAHLSGAELVAHLSDTCRRADFDAVARILKARDLRDARILVELRAALVDLDAATARGCGDAGPEWLGAVARVSILSCRHGLVLVRDWEEQDEMVVCDPITSEMRHVAVPPEFRSGFFSGEVLCAAGDQGHVHGAAT